MKQNKLYGIGVDFGTDSVRIALVRYDNGTVLQTASSLYSRWAKGLFCNPSLAQFRQHPSDYQESLFAALQNLLSDLSQEERDSIGFIGVGATGSTVSPVNGEGVPLALLEEFSEDPDAMFSLWKDHTATKEAQEFNTLCSRWETDYTCYQGSYSSEWFWAKIAHTGRKSPKVRKASQDWMELCDWIPLLLTGKQQITYRSQCAAAHKALWNSKFDGLPSHAFLSEFDAYAAEVHQQYTQIPQPCSANLGYICSSWASPLGLCDDVVVGGSTLDAYVGAVGAGIGPGVLVSVLGTSAVHMTVLPYAQMEDQKSLADFAGLAEDSIIPGFWGVESGQAAFGDVLSWFARCLAPFAPEKKSILPRLDEMLATSEIGKEIIALEWLNGRRYPNGSDKAEGAFVGLDLSSDAASMYGALTNSILFGLRSIVEGMQKGGLHFDSMVATGGIARKSEVLMKRLASVLNLPILALFQQETCALGAAMYGSVACGYFADLEEAQKAMASRQGVLYEPVAPDVALFDALYEKYLKVGASMEPLW